MDCFQRRIFSIARKYLLQLNETKLFSSRVPFILDGWLNETNGFTNRMCDMLFNSKEEQKAYVEKYLPKKMMQKHQLLMYYHIYLNHTLLGMAQKPSSQL